MRTLTLLGIATLLAIGATGCAADPDADENVGTVSSALTVSTDRYDFGSIPDGCTADTMIRISNDGTSNITITSITSSDSRFVPGSYPSSLRGGEWFDLQVDFVPDTNSTFQGDVTIDSTDPDVVIHFEGVGLPPDPC